MPKSRPKLADADPAARPTREPDSDSAGAGSASMAGKVIALKCRGCSTLVPTDRAWNRPEDGMQAECPVCGTVTVWRDYEVVDPPPAPRPEPTDEAGEAIGEALAGESPSGKPAEGAAGESGPSEPAAEAESAPEPSAASELFHGDEPKAADEPRADAAGPGPGGLAGAEPAG